MPTESPRGDADEAALTLLEHLPGLVALFEGADLRITAMNAAARALVGDITGQRLPEAMPELLGQEVTERIREVYETGEPFHGDEWRVNFRDVGGDLREVFVNLAAEPLRWPDGSMRGVVTTAAMVTDLVRARRQAEARSVELRERAHDAQEMLLTLQDELLPDSLPVLPGIDIAASYLLADADTSAGGDWFDALPLAGQRVALVVGDVVGHGVGASAVMGRLRAVLEERLRSGSDLLEALTALDRFAAHDPEAHAATVCVTEVDLTDGSMRYCTAGHPPPIVVATDGTASYLPASGSGALVTGRRYVAAEHVLDEGDVLLLYTDGIVERPGRTVAQNTVELLKAAADAVEGRGLTVGLAEHAVDRVAHHPLEVLTRVSGFTDDITLLAAQRRPAPPPLRLDLPAVPDSLREALTGLMGWLEAQRVRPNDVMALAHAAGELVSNVIDHAYREPGTDPERETMTVTASLTVEGAARIEIIDGGTWREPERSTERGRGLAMASGLVDHLELDRRTDGTSAVVVHRLHRHVELLTDIFGARPGGTEPARELTTVEGDGRLQVTGPVDRVSIDTFRSALRRANAGGARELTVDLTGVTHLASTGVQALVESLAGSSTSGPGGRPGPALRLLAPFGTPAQHVLDVVGLPYLTDPQPEYR